MSTESNRDPLTDRLLKAALRPHERAVSDACLDAETLAAWADGSVPGQAASAIEAHLADCARCQSMLAVFATSESAESADLATAGVAETAASGSVIPFRPRVRWLVPVAAGAAAASLLIWTAWPRPGAPIAPAEQTMARDASPAAVPPAGAVEVQPGMPAAATPMSKPAPTESDARRNRTEKTEARSLTDARRQARASAIAKDRTPPASAAAPVATPSPTPPVKQEIVRTATPTVSQTVSADFVQTLPRSDRNALSYLVLMPGVSVLPSGIVEFAPPPPAALAGNVGAAAGAGRGGAGAGRGAAMAVGRALPSLIRWRVLTTGVVERSTSDGATWEVVTLDPPAFIVSGAAPSVSVCWLVGRAGTVLRSEDGIKFVKVAFPEAVDLKSIVAIDARQAKVTTVDGRVLTTIDGGATWQ